ncbi:sporulation histidine kinase inhibitor Sda [Oceanobacillus sojae]|uniref:sporulation histidine kinase inhibitor Sda n=1 Tax=Oceanobacillus sojae TaxID=582851 RepID=UPI00098867A8|nr:sporulation histidine kinase inhibitor Sda [Oceanobacillus sojae]
MENLGDKLLIEAYFKAKELNLDIVFIKMLAIELRKRSIDIRNESELRQLLNIQFNS